MKLFRWSVLALALFLSIPNAVQSQEESELKKATFAGGCFWCMQPPYDKLDGVVATSVGYSGGTEVDPTYQEVARGLTSHAEVVQVTYDPSKVSYETLLTTFWHNINPTQVDRQFADKGRQYRTAIYYHDSDQQRAAMKSKGALEASGKFSKPIATEITPFNVFYAAEEYHQKYYLKNPKDYNRYKKYSGREGYLKRTWGNEG